MAITGVVHAGVTKDNKAARQTACLPPPLVHCDNHHPSGEPGRLGPGQ